MTSSMASASSEAEAQPGRDTENESLERQVDDELPTPPHKSGVYLDPFAQKQACRFSKGDMVHMSITENGARRKGVFKIHKARYNQSGGYPEYQLVDNGILYNRGSWVREKELRADKPLNNARS